MKLILREVDDEDGGVQYALRMKKNAQLKEFYDGVYKKGERSHYTQFRLQKGDLPEEFSAVFALLDWTGKEVLDVGCGTGNYPALLSKQRNIYMGDQKQDVWHNTCAQPPLR